MKALLLLLLALLPLTSSAFPFPKLGRYYGTLVYRSFDPDNRSVAASQRVMTQTLTNTTMIVTAPPVAVGDGSPRRVTFYVEFPDPAGPASDVALLHTKDSDGNYASTVTGTFKIRGKALTLTFEFPEDAYHRSTTVFTLTYKDAL